MKTPLLVSMFIMLVAGSSINVAISQKASKSEYVKPDFVTEGFSAGFSSIDSASKIKLWIVNAAEKRFTISFTGNGVYWNTSSRETYYGQALNLSQLEDGEYVLEVNCGTKKFQKKILIATNTYTQREMRVVQ